jgi:hypothetical protein
MSNPANKATFAWAAKRVVTHYREIGLIGGSSEKIWRAGGFL